MNPKVDWILVADRTRAVVVHVLPGSSKPWPVVETWTHPEGRMNAAELKSDMMGRPGLPATVRGVGNARGAMEPHEELSHIEARKFANEIANALDHARMNGRFDRLIVVAAPMFLGKLRNEWSEPLKKMIAHEANHDLAGFNDQELLERLKQIQQEVPSE